MGAEGAAEEVEEDRCGRSCTAEVEEEEVVVVVVVVEVVEEASGRMSGGGRRMDAMDELVNL